MKADGPKLAFPLNIIGIITRDTVNPDANEMTNHGIT